LSQLQFFKCQIKTENQLLSMINYHILRNKCCRPQNDFDCELG